MYKNNEPLFSSISSDFCLFYRLDPVFTDRWQRVPAGPAGCARHGAVCGTRREAGSEPGAHGSAPAGGTAAGAPATRVAR